MPVRPSPRLHLGQSSSALASLLLVLTLGFGVVEAWHAEEHADEGSCAECALCDVATQGPVAGAAETPDPLRPDPVSGLADLEATATHVARERRPDAPRAPPA